MNNVSQAASNRMIEAGREALGDAPGIEVDSFGRLRMRYSPPSVARIYQAMDAARLAEPDGYSNAERIVTDLAAALQARGLESLDELLAGYDAYHGTPQEGLEAIAPPESINGSKPRKGRN